MKVKTKFKDFLNENNNEVNKKYQEVEFDVDDENLIEDTYKRLDIIDKHFPFNNVIGKVANDWIKLFFDNDRIRIEGDYNEDTETLLATFKMPDEEFDFEFSYHRFGPMGGADLEDFNKEITIVKWAYDDKEKYSFVMGKEGYATHVLKVGAKEDALDTLREYNIYLVKGTQIEGKQVGITKYSDEKQPYEDLGNMGNTKEFD
jgi:hypothetical protein